jgi:hypothetical protein
MSYYNQLEQYFSSKKLDVSFNTLGATELLVDLFIQETADIVSACSSKISNHVKNQCYNKYFKIENRTKFTGFEKFHKLDQSVRSKMNNHIQGLIGKIEYEKPTKEYVIGSYLDELKNSFKKFNNPLLYLSGGIDSEFVALAMLDAEVKFTPVIFQWVNDSQQVLNTHDILYALDFCNEHHLTPLIRRVNLEKLWNNIEFELLAKETQNSSPQVNTYVYMIEQMAEEFKDSTHVFGGEVRFRIVEHETKISNFVTAAKVSPTGYNGATYNLRNGVMYATMHSGLAFLSLMYAWDGNYANNQEWNIVGAVDSGGKEMTSANSFTGNWFNADLPGGTGFDFRTSNDGGSSFTSWTTLSIGNNVVATKAIAGTMDSDNSGSANIVVEIRSKSNPGVVVSSSLTFSITYDYEPTLATFSANGTFTPPAGITSFSILGVGGGGGGGGAERTSGNGGEFNGAAGGGGAGGQGAAINGVAYSSGIISFTVGTAGAGVDGANGTTGNATTFTLPSTAVYGANGGGGGFKNPSGGTTAAGNGGSNSSYSGGSGWVGDPSYIDESYGGGGAGSNGNGSNAVAPAPFGGAAGLGGAGTLFGLTKAGSTYNITYGVGGQGGACNGSGGVSADPGSIPGGGGDGGGIIVYTDTGPGSIAGANGGAGRVYIYY